MAALVTVSSAQLTEFTGANGLAWNNSGSWTNGVPDSNKEFVIPYEVGSISLGFPTLVIISGYAAYAEKGSLGGAPGEAGSLSIQNGGSLTVVDRLTVGGAEGSLEVTGGSAVTGNHLILGSGLGSLSSMLVSGANSTIQFSSVYLGLTNDPMYVTIEDGGRATIGTAIMDVDAGAGKTISSALIQLHGTEGSRGVLALDWIKLNSQNNQLKFDGGVVEARSSREEIFVRDSIYMGTLLVSLQSGGGYYDTAGHNIGTAVAMSGSGALHKIGNGTLTLNGANTYTGGTFVTQGTLVVAAGASTGAGAVVVGEDGILGGNGTLAGDTSIFGRLMPGNSIGQINITSFTGNPSLDFASSALTQIEIGSLGSFDRVAVDGSISYGGTLQVDLLNRYLPNVGDTFQIFSAGMVSTGAFEHILFSNPNYEGSFNTSNGVLQITAIPEPCGVSLLMASCAGMLLLRSRTAPWAAPSTRR